MADSTQERMQARPSLGHVLVLGLGKSGQAVARYCLDLLGGRVASLSIAADSIGGEQRSFAQACERRGAHVLVGQDLVEQAAGGMRFDLCVASPGIPPHAPIARHARELSTEAISEVELAWRESPAASRWVAVTGTNGKTTTTALVAHLLAAAGIDARCVGNIGVACIDAVREGYAGVYVAEVSSYQLASTKDFAPDAAVLLNITPDHLSWHGDFDAYRAAKEKVFANLSRRSGAVAVLDAVDAESRARVRRMRAVPDDARGFVYIPVGTAAGYEDDMRARCGSDNAAFVRPDGRLQVALRGVEHVLCRRDDLRIPGVHNLGNALAAASCAVALGAADDAVAAGLAGFESLEHRIEACGSVRGVRCYNDSKATNVDATLAALAAFDPKRPIVLLGGDDKGTDLTPLVQAACAHCKEVVCFGAAEPRFSAAFAGASVPASRAANMEAALDVALAHAKEGDIVLLSPACASFDEFQNYQQRGRVFKRLVAVRAAQSQGTGAR